MSSPPRVNAVVLAGGGDADALARAAGVASKSLVPLAGAPMGAYVASALRSSGVVERIVYVGPADARIAAMVDHVVPSGARMVDSLALGFGAAFAGAEAAQRILLVTGDVPWWRAEGVRDFVADAPAAALVYPVVRAETALAAFPQQRRTFVRLRDGRFTGGNAALLTPEAAIALLPVIDQVFRARKAPWRLAALVGIDVVVGLVTGRVSLERLETRISAILGVAGRVLISDDAGIAADVDKPAQLALAGTGGPPLASLLGPS